MHLELALKSLYRCSCDTVLNGPDIDHCWHNTREIISDAVDKTTPVFFARNRTKVDWLASSTGKQLRFEVLFME